MDIIFDCKISTRNTCVVVLCNLIFVFVQKITFCVERSGRIENYIAGFIGNIFKAIDISRSGNLSGFLTVQCNGRGFFGCCPVVGIAYKGTACRYAASVGGSGGYGSCSGRQLSGNLSGLIDRGNIGIAGRPYNISVYGIDRQDCRGQLLGFTLAKRYGCFIELYAVNPFCGIDAGKEDRYYSSNRYPKRY